MEEFVKGREVSQNKSEEMTKVDKVTLDKLKEKLKIYYDWNLNKSVAEMAGQDCSEMLIRVGKF